MRSSVTRPDRTSWTTSSGQDSPPNWSQPAFRTISTRSSGLRCSTPHARAGIGCPSSSASVMRPQSVQTMPSKPSRSRSRPVITPRLNPKATGSSSVSMGIP